KHGSTASPCSKPVRCWPGWPPGACRSRTDLCPGRRPPPRLWPVTTSTKQVLLAAPHGYCAGVDRAIEAVERACSTTAHRCTCATRQACGGHAGRARRGLRLRDRGGPRGRPGDLLRRPARTRTLQRPRLCDVCAEVGPLPGADEHAMGSRVVQQARRQPTNGRAVVAGTAAPCLGLTVQRSR